MSDPDLRKLESALGYKFHNQDLLRQALTHSSWARELESQNATQSSKQDVPDNEQLEFLGDAVLGFVTSQELFSKLPEFSEGNLSKLRGYLVSERHLLSSATKLKVGTYLRLGRGEEKTGGRTKTTIMVDALEALIAAIYLDSGLEEARKFVLGKVLREELRKVDRRKGTLLPVTDYKSALQETAHSMGMGQPRYVVVGEHGPQHDKIFTIEVRIARNGGTVSEYSGRAEGSTKKKGEQEVAKAALLHLQKTNRRRSKPAEV